MCLVMSDLVGIRELETLRVGERCADLSELWSGSCYCGDDGSSHRTGRYNAPRKHAASLLDGARFVFEVAAYVVAQLRGCDGP